MNPQVSNPNDLKVVEFTNPTDFTFTPEMGCMFDGRPIFGITGAPGINAGESLKLPYHVGHRLAVNLAKAVLMRQAPSVDPAGIPTGVPLWDTVKLEKMKNSYITELYSEQKPIALSETDRLMAKVEEYKKMVDSLIASKGENKSQETSNTIPESTTIPKTEGSSNIFQDKAEVIAELKKRNITFDARASKVNLEKLLA